MVRRRMASLKDFVRPRDVFGLMYESASSFDGRAVSSHSHSTWAFSSAEGYPIYDRLG